MKIALINGSPRGRKATSEWVLDEIEKNIEEQEVKKFYFTNIPKEQILREILTYDTLIFAYPNYFGGIPSHVFEAMVLLEQLAVNTKKNIKVFTVVNCGFYFSTENRFALETMHNWCNKAGFVWGKGVSIGAGGGCTVINQISLVRYTLNPIWRSLKKLADLIQNENSLIKDLETSEDWYVEIGMPCRLYVFVAERNWCRMAKKNGLRKCDL